MALDTFSPPVPPFAPLNLDEQPRMLRSQLGDGYVVAAVDGVNNSPLNATLAWNQLSATDYNTILTFLRAHIGLFFYYTLPSETTARKWEALSWKPNQQSSWFELQVLLQERFDQN
jgi:phage-related protein